MGLLLLIFGVIAGAGFWWWRIQQARDAVGAAADLAGKARGMISRARFRSKSEGSVLTAVDDARIAVAVLLYSLMADRRPVTLDDQARLGAKLREVCGLTQKESDEAVSFAGWAAGQVADTHDVVRRLTPLWRHELDIGQKQDLVRMAEEMASPGGQPPTDAQAGVLRRLSEALLPPS